jgi:2-(1,2-epoxy-1,2-dihydrophenyl)acetyl-CoA isomerase
MDFREIILRQQDGVSTIILNRPDLMNVLTFDMLRELQQALKCCAADEDTKVIVLTGTGRVFSAGERYSGRWCQNEYQRNSQLYRCIAEMIRLITSIDKPIIASVNGLAAGACFDIFLLLIWRLLRKMPFHTRFSKLGMLPMQADVFPPAYIGFKKGQGDNLLQIL